MSDTDGSSKQAPKRTTNKPGRGLGRGLDALLGDTLSTQTKKNQINTPNSNNDGDIRDVPIEYIRANPSQPRKSFAEDAIAELADSIKTKGLLQPVLVRPLKQRTGAAKYEIVAGERRWRAAQKAQLHKIPVLIREMDDQETVEIALIENIQRVDLNVMEEADTYLHLNKSYGRTQQQISSAVGKSRSHVANIMRLLDLPERVRKGVRENKISMGHARALLSSPKPEEDYMAILANNLSVRDTEILVRQKTNRKSDKSAQKTEVAYKNTGPKDADTRALERNLAEALGLEVAIDHQKSGKGQVTIDYLTLDQLDDVCRRLLGSAI